MSTLTPASRTAYRGEWAARVQVLRHLIRHVENSIHHQLVKHGVTSLRIALGLVFLGFGILKYFPGVSPAQTVVEQTTHILFLHLIPGDIAIKLIATLECFIGVCLLSNRWMRLCVWLLAIEAIGILSPIFVLSSELFSGPHHAPTLLGQYCLKDIILVAAGFVVAAASFRGGRMIRTDLPPSLHVAPEPTSDPEHRLRVVLEGLNDPEGTAALCERHQISESEFHDWRETVLAAATASLADSNEDAPTDPSAAATSAAPRPLSPVMTLLALITLRRL